MGLLALARYTSTYLYMILRLLLFVVRATLGQERHEHRDRRVAGVPRDFDSLRRGPVPTLR